jgi:hypothetical protein
MSIRQSILDKLQTLTEVSVTCGGRAFWLHPTKQDDLPCVVFWLVSGAPIARFGRDQDSCAPHGPKRVQVQFASMSRDAAQAITIIENILADDPTGLNGGSWTLDGTSVLLTNFAEITEDDFLEAPFVGYTCGCVMDITYD